MLMFRRTILLLLLCIVETPVGWAQDSALDGLASSSSEPRQPLLSDPRASGALRLDYFSSSKSLDDNTGFHGVTANMKMLPVFSDMFDAKMEARFNAPDLTRGDRSPSTATLLEAYVTTHFQNVDLRIGKQNAAWGRADAINPTDNLTPHDYTVLLPFEEDQRFGTAALKLDAYLSPDYTIEIFTTPLFVPSKIPLSLPTGASIQKNHTPAQTLSNSEVGIRLNKSGGETDWSVSYYHGFSLIPEICFGGFEPPSSLLLELKYPEINVVGVDAARNYGRYGFRAEAAYVTPKDYSEQEHTVLQPYLFYVLGTDRTFLENVNVNLQFVGRWVPNFRDPDAINDPILRALATENAILFGQLHRGNYGLTSRISNRWLNDTLEAELLLAAYFEPDNAYLRPLITYAFTDRMKGSIGGEIYAGSHNSYFGLLKSNKGFFTEVRYSF